MDIIDNGQIYNLSSRLLSHFVATDGFHRYEE